MSDRAWAATRKGLIELRRAAGGWQLGALAFAGEPVTQVLPADPSWPDRPMFAALNLGHFGVKLHASDDGGAHWREVAAPIYPAQPPDTDDVPWKLVLIWSLAAAGAVVYAGTLPGGLFRSDDGGRHWTLNRALWDRPERHEWFGGGYDVPGIHSILIDPHDHERMLLGISCGGAWATADAGRSWSLATTGMHADFMPPGQADNPNIQDPHAIAACAADRSVLWCQHHNGIFRSTDGATSWSRVRGVPVSDFGFAVAAHPRDPSVAWFVPGIKDECRIPPGQAMAVIRARDGGQRFDVLREGLPQRDCFDLVYRHGLAVSADCTRLLMGSTTGNLWASDDGGGVWRQVGAHLPPIHAVVFATV